MTSPLTTSEDSQALLCSFKVPARHTSTVQITVEPNKDPGKLGSCLLFPEQPIDAFLDFPVCNAKVKSPDDDGYAAVYGWIQMVREAPSSFKSSQSTDLWELDPIPITANIDTPFIWFGPEPQLFDAPFRANRTDMDWTCWSFLTYIEDSLMSRSVRPILVFEWGFQIQDGNVTIKSLRLIDVRDAWEQQRGMLEKMFSSWLFEPAYEDVEVSDLSGRAPAA